MALLTILIGPRGGGKSTAVTQVAQEIHQDYPRVPIVANVPIEHTVYVPDIIKFLATRLIVEGAEKPFTENPNFTVHITEKIRKPPFMAVIIDEGAISGFEARGSGSYSLDTYLLALSRKLNIDIWLISQLMSMLDKRGQWLADFYWLCEAHLVPNTKIVDYFTFKVFDENFKHTTTFYLDGKFAYKYLFPRFNTDDIPNYAQLAIAYRNQHNIRPEDHQFYNQIVDYYKGIGALKTSKQDDWFSRRWIAFWEAAA